MAKQRVVAGGEIDAVTSDEIAALIRALVEDQSDRYAREHGAVPLSAGGGGTDRHVQISPSYDVCFDSVTIGGGASAANALVLFYANDENSDTNLVGVVQLGAAGRYSDTKPVMYLPANTRLVTVVSGGPANGQVTFNLFGRRLSPGISR